MFIIQQDTEAIGFLYFTLTTYCIYLRLSFTLDKVRRAFFLYLLRPPYGQPHLLELLQGLAALQVVRDGHPLAVHRQAADKGRVGSVVLVAHLLEVADELGDTEPVSGRGYRLAVQQDVLGGQLDVSAILRCTHLEISGSGKGRPYVKCW